jgi:hypothetical protein
MAGAEAKGPTLPPAERPVMTAIWTKESRSAATQGPPREARVGTALREVHSLQPNPGRTGEAHPREAEEVGEVGWVSSISTAPPRAPA